ncbi:hypothetical protein NW762_001457 [Fusarium torreyae]|uniref:Uncharacterized protein n=1 Tax=Fusarium torreyae TaxID=1237075 RepID=A0A9W8SDW8_9HYPO|nr:hypothetical protein NW762_001457 [Fusarium torreyae]
MTHWTCAWCNDRWDSKYERVVCAVANEKRNKGRFGSCGKMEGKDISIYDLFCPKCPPKNPTRIPYRGRVG